MRLTSSYSVFRFDPSEQDLAKPRWLAKEGKVAEAEGEYRRVLGRNPDLYAGWIELSELLRNRGHAQDALELADAAERHWGPDAAMPHALRGAALAQLGHLTDGLAALQRAIELDGGFFLAWHEYGYACFRAGHHSEALLALDRAFALEPHTDTLMLRGRILREGGRYDAAEVAFEGAMQATEHDVPRRDAEREIRATRRAAGLGGKRLRDATPRERWFVRDGGVLLEESRGDGPLAGALARAVASLVALTKALDWRPAAVAGASADDRALAETVGAMLGAAPLAASALDPADRPLIVTVRSSGRDEWTKQLDRLARWSAGSCFALLQGPESADGADVVGVGADPDDREVESELGEALRRAPDVAAALAPEALTLAQHPLATWRQRAAAPPPR